jgi:RNA polymerase sigma factor (sigma-70 family)
MRDGSHEQLLHQLGTPSAGEAWRAFLRQYTPLIVSVARQYARDRQGLHDCYLYVCEKLVDDGFRRLRAWRRKENVRFSSWLRAVVANLGVDWHRSEYGRQRPFQSIAELPEMERLVYTHRFEFGASFSECFEAVSIRFPAVTELELAATIREISRLLTPQQHWALSTRRQASVSVDDRQVRREVSLQQPPETPEQHTQEQQEQTRVEAALRNLPTSQRVLLKLRYQQGLPLKEVARLAGLADAFQARYQIRLALDALQRLLSN